jgi:hypothetical protein
MNGSVDHRTPTIVTLGHFRLYLAALANLRQRS